MADQNEMNGIDDVEIEPLSDEALEDVAGGAAEADGSSNCCSCSCCSGGISDDDDVAPIGGGVN